jgi:hypothetical protein
MAAREGARNQQRSVVGEFDYECGGRKENQLESNQVGVKIAEEKEQ